MINSLKVFELRGSVIGGCFQSSRGRRHWCIKIFWKNVFHKPGEMQHIKNWMLEGKDKGSQKQKYEMTLKKKFELELKKNRND